MKKSAVLVIDVQKGLFDSSPRPYEADEVLARINQFTAKARQEQWPVYFIQHEKDHTALQRGEPGWSLAAELNVEKSDHVVAKSTPDAFLKSDLHEQLQHHAITHLYICGYASEFCVDTTTRRAAALGYQVTLVADAHTTHDKPHASGEQIRAHHNFTLSNITSFGPRIFAKSLSSLL